MLLKVLSASSRLHSWHYKSPYQYRHVPAMHRYSNWSAKMTKFLENLAISRLGTLNEFFFKNHYQYGLLVKEAHMLMEGAKESILPFFATE